jgi:para-aminobenzoate synthetase/4-amino-4-deoxychorismate lyase
VRLSLSRDGRVATDVSAPTPAPSAPVRLAIADDAPVDPRDVWLFHKTTRRDAYDRRRGSRPDADDVVLVNTAGRATETTIANLAVRIGDGWWTPPIEDGLLAGTFRAVLLREGVLRERSLSVGELRRANEIAVVSSVRGWRPAVLLGPDADRP